MFSGNRFGIPVLLLSVIVGLLAYYNYEVWLKPFPQIPMKEAPKKTEGKPRAEGPAAVAVAKEAVPSGYIRVISEKNMFSPDRKEFASTPGGEPVRPVTRPQVVLHGVVIAEKTQMATIVNPGRPLRRGEREAMTVKIGDRVGEYKLAQVMPDKIVLEAPGDTFEVLLVDPKAPKKRIDVRTATPAVAVTSASAGAGAAAPPPPVVPPAVPAGPPTAIPTVPGMAPSPIPRPVMPIPAIPSTVPGPMGPTPQVGVPTPMPGPPAPTPIPDPGSYRGRRFMGPGGSTESR